MVRQLKLQETLSQLLAGAPAVIKGSPFKGKRFHRGSGSPRKSTFASLIRSKT